MQGVYVIRHVPTDRCYVGSSVEIERRWKEHKWRFASSTHPAKHLMAVFRRDGESAFEFRVLEECDVTDEVMQIERENHWIQLLKPVFNVAPVAGSVLGLKHSLETLENMSQAQKDRYAANPSKLKGRPRTEEAKAAISAGSKGKSLSETHIANLSAALKGRVSPRKGVTLSEETKARISAGRKGIPRSAGASARAAESNRGKTRTAEQRARMSAAKIGKTFSAEARENMSRAAKARRATAQ